MTKLARTLVAVGALLLLGVYAVPLWRVHLIAPQYPEGLGMKISVHNVTGVGEHDLDNINELNHYIGMKRIEPEAIPELRFMPWVVAALAAVGLTAAALGRRRLVFAWLALFLVVGAAGLADFWKWEYTYGHELDLEHAIIIVPGMSYQPPLIGTKQLLNFTAASWPDAGALLIALAFGCGAAALIVGRRRDDGPRRQRPRRSHGRRGLRRHVAVASALLVVLLPATPCAQTLDVGAGHPFTTITAALRAAPPHATVVVHAGTYREPTIAVTRPVHLVGDGAPLLDGAGTHAVLIVRADDVTVRGLRFANTGASDIEDRAAIRVERARDCAIEHVRVANAMFGIYLAGVQGCRVADNTLHGNDSTEALSGNGIHLWTARDVRIEHNTVGGHRDGIYFEFVQDSRIADNVSTGNLRYGLHFMFSDDCLYEGNTFRDNGAGVAVMYTRHVEMLGNRFLDNWGPASYGLLLKDITDSRLEHNLFRRNTVALVADGANRLVASGNTFVLNGWGIRLAASTDDARFTDNEFLGNTFDVASNGSAQTSVFSHNYWDAYRGYDLDGDGFGDAPYRPVSLFSLVTERHPAALVLLHSAFVSLLDVAERAFPVLTPEAVVDPAPRMRSGS